jgi:plastocyanin
MQQSLMRRLRRSSLRWVAACGVTAALALPSIPAAAQPGDLTRSGASTPANCTIQLSVANPNPGDQEIPHALIMSGTAVDTTAASSAGIAQVQIFLGNRDQGGAFLGAATFVDNPADAPGAWSIASVIPANMSGGQSVFVYGTSSVSGQAAFVSIPVVVGESLQGSVSNQVVTFCPTLVAPTPTNPPAAPAAPTPAPAQAAPAPPQPAPTPLAPVPAAPTPQPPAAPAVAAPQPAAPPAPVSAPVTAPAPMAAQLSISSPLSPPLAFNTNMLSASAGAQVTLTYTNDSPIEHNWHVFNGPDSSAPTLAATQIIAGPSASDAVTFTAPTQPGNYFFWCDVHPTIMTGNLVIN